MSANRGTPFDALFQALTERMRVLHTATPDTDPSQRDRVEWAHDGFTRENIPYNIPGTVTVGRHAHRYKVSVYGATELEVASRAAEIEGHLWNLIGPPQGAPPPAGNGYKVGSTSTPTRGGDGISAGFACVVEITLNEPVFSEVRPKLAVTHPGVTTTATAGQGASASGSIEWQG